MLGLKWIGLDRRVMNSISNLIIINDICSPHESCKTIDKIIIIMGRNLTVNLLAK